MFDVGFQELILIGVVALIVIGPERLPKAARIAGMWLGRARRTLANVKHEIDREMKTEELNEILERQTRSNSLETLLEDTAPPKSPDKRTSAPVDDPPPRS